MPDLLIRNLPEPLRGEIRKAAATSGRSLSEEAKHLIRKGLSASPEGPEHGNSAWDEIRNALGEAQLADAEHEDFLAAAGFVRKAAIRKTTEFE
ncbi:MAG: plasmid stabilization protein [Hoeflea sp.]|uniref:FitA-like ribbon-helix-helix domain-containing protein n=1 Tax=Hoeflea sp. TaxID=1940281 RepID=UPI0032EBD278